MSGVPAGIEYVGVSGISKECQDAVLRLLQFGNKISRAQILSSSRVSYSGASASGVHCLLLTVESGDVIAVKSGFSSGYRGEGPRTFSEVLQILESGDEAGALARLADDLPLFRMAQHRPPPVAAKQSVAEAMLKDMSPDELTPREALELLYKLKAALPEA